jgi:signal peptidase I
MQPTIEINDRVFAEKVSYHFSSVRPGDIVTFSDPEPGYQDRVLIKRVIATGGQTIDLQDGKVLVDGQILDEPYTHGKESAPLPMQLPGVTLKFPYTVPEGEIWVMGDNRTNSADSRYFGPIDETSVLGHAVLRIWPLDRFGLL